MEKKIGYEFMQKTGKHVSLSAQQRGEPQPPLEWAAPADAVRFALPDPKNLQMPSADFRTVVEQRRSVRKYSEDALSLAELSYLLWMKNLRRMVRNRYKLIRRGYSKTRIASPCM